jgi:diacylglycerol kinase family enzyme
MGIQTTNLTINPINSLLWLEADGEFLGTAPATFQIKPKAISIVT